MKVVPKIRQELLRMKGMRRSMFENVVFELQSQDGNSDQWFESAEELIVALISGAVPPGEYDAFAGSAFIATIHAVPRTQIR